MSIPRPRHRPTLRRHFATIAVAPLVVLAACGSDDDAGGGDPVGTDLPEVTATVPETAPPTDSPATADAYADVEAVLEFGRYGGFMMREQAFAMTPDLLITGDGVVLTPAPTPAIYPGPLVAPMQARTIAPEGIQALVDAAADAGLLRDVEYERNEMIADASDTVVRIDTGDGEYEHRAYALGIAGPDAGDDDPDRQALADFIASLQDLEAIVGPDALGEAEPWVPAAYQVVAFPIADLDGYEVEPTIETWPAAVGVTLAELEASACTEIDRDAVGDLFDAATELTFFGPDDPAADGTVYQLAVRPAFPGRDC